MDFLPGGTTDALDPSYGQAVTMGDKLVKLYDACEPEMIANATLTEFIWAAAAVSSRAFRVVQGQKLKDLLLVPLAEFFNHGEKFQAEFDVISFLLSPE